MFQRITQFLREARVELKRVNWPTRQETIRMTLVVVGVSAAVALFLGGLDYVFSVVLNKVLF